MTVQQPDSTKPRAHQSLYRTRGGSLNPAEAIAAAGRELVDELRQLVDRGTADDIPGLLDELTALLRRARGRVNRATKKGRSRQATGRAGDLVERRQVDQLHDTSRGEAHTAGPCHSADGEPAHRHRAGRSAHQTGQQAGQGNSREERR